ncbi:tetratricopeptide repeat protein [Pannonibacter phragmitetus]|uniref:tetratricopeptide repeat protein n=1 Tax=Pannonibacter phragmitetus TaxID=121719 RepID=UPI000F44730D|nr:tetratricopeptide repeat protein [Pannonibacter phragmitetus]
MTTLTDVPAQKRKISAGRCSRLLLGVALLMVPVQVQASSGEPVATQPQYGTPQDLPVTQAGSYLAARLAARWNDFPSAAAFFEEALGTDPENGLLVERAFMLRMASGDFEDARILAEDMQALKIRNFMASLLKSLDLARDGSFREASQTLESDGGGPLADLTVGVSKAWFDLGAGDLKKALAGLDALKGPDWFNVFKHNHAALMAQQAGRMDIALTRIKQAYEADRGALKVADTYAILLASAGKKKEALAVLNQYDQLIPSHPILSTTRARIEKGETFGPVVADPLTGIAELLSGLGSAIGNDGAEELGAALLNLSLDLNGDGDFAALALGGLYNRLNAPDRAITALERVPESSPLKRDAEIQIGLNFNALDKVDESRQHLQALIDKDPADLEAIIALGNVLRSREMFAEAEVVYTKGIDTVDKPQPEHWGLYYNRGICRERLKKWNEAEVDLRTALELYPDQPQVLNYLGYSLVDQGMKLDEAMQMIQTAVRLRPSDGYIVDSLGWAYYRLGRYEEATRELERAVQLRPADPVINDHLGDAYWKVGRRLEARFQWNHARDLNPTPEDLVKILDKIENGMPDTPAAVEASAPPKNGG